MLSVLGILYIRDEGLRGIGFLMYDAIGMQV